jgi:putative hydrolase of the HAD superfamily
VTAGPGVEAVVFDWGGTLTRWHDVDFHAEALALARAVVDSEHEPHVSAERLRAAGAAIWGCYRDAQQSATADGLFAEAGVRHDPGLLAAYYDFWEPHTHTDPDVGPLLEALRADGLRIGVLSNTIWPRSFHEEIFERDGVRHLIDGDVYTSEIPWTKPSPLAFAAALDAVGASDPARCVYVGDRLFDDIWGAQNAGLRAVHVPHSTIPADQVGHSEGRPDASVQRLADVLEVVRAWR